MAFLALELGKLFLLKRDPTADLAHAPALVHYAFEKCGNPLFEHISSINSAVTTVDCRGFLSKLPRILQITGSISPSAVQKVIFNLFLNDYTALLKTLFIESWTSQTKAHKELASERAMAKELKTILDGSATQQAAMAVDTEPTVDPKILRDLIKTQIQTETKKIHSELNKLSQKVTRQGTTTKPTTPSSKKSPRGPIDVPRHQRNLVGTTKTIVNSQRTGANRRRRTLAQKPATTATETQTTLQPAPTTALRATAIASLLQTTRRRKQTPGDRRSETIREPVVVGR